ncbi:MAG TPA: translocation/assembly module TamB domain-containing protein [Steroidobacteraceae bacterium]|nr:translocation/assembly module TamB domain-containing protein [Steroidobacteraceae bacterium]
MKRRHVAFYLVAALLLAAPVVLVRHLLYTQRGLEQVLAALAHIEDVHIEVKGARGVIAGPLEFDYVVVDHAAVHVDAYGVRGTPAVLSLLAGRLAIRDASVDRVEVTIKERGPQPDTPVHFLPAWLGIVAPEAVIRQVGVTLKDGTRLHVASVRADLRMTRWRIDVAPFVLQDPAGRVDGEIFLRAGMPLGLRGKLAGRWKLPDDHLYRVSLVMNGRLDRLGVEAALTEPAQIAFAGSALDLEHVPRIVGTLRITDFDGSPWLPAGRLPASSGSIAVDASERGIGFDGTLASHAVGHELVRVRGSATYGDDILHVASLRTWLPKSGASIDASGAVEFAGEAPRVDMRGEWTSLRWPLAGEPLVVSPAGSLRLAGAMPYEFDLRARASGPQLPAADFTAQGSIDREELRVQHLDANMLQGQVSGSGRVSLGTDESWEATVDGRGLDPSTLRRDLSGRVDVAAGISGRGFSATAPWTVRLAKLSGTLNGRALTGRGEISHHDGTYDLTNVRVANAGSHVDVDGRYGPTLDLRFDADLKSLALLDASLQGELSGSGTLRGDRTRPAAKAQLRGRRLKVGDFAAGSASVDVDVDLADHRPSSILVRSSGVTAGRIQFDSVRLEASGLMGEHRVALALISPGSEGGQVPGFEAALAATGSVDVAGRSWHGTLEQASFDFTDGSARLAQPVTLSVGPELASATPLCLVTGDARLCAEGEWHATPGSWRVLYSAQDWPLRRLLTSLLGRREFDGLLQLSGWAEQQPGHDWVGGTAVVIDHPTVDIRRNRFRSDRVEIGGGRLDLYADESRVRATADLEMAAGTRLQGEVSAPRERGRPLADSPLTGEVRAESSVLTVMPLFVPEIDHSEGRLDADVHVGGTLGDPRFDGEFHLRDGRLDLYRTNLSLTQANVDGQFAGDTLTFEGRATTPKGPVSLSGRFTWPDGVMTGSMRLTGQDLLVADTPEYRVQASPDLTIRAGRDGFDVTGQIVIPWARISPKDLSTSVATSPDERIVGARAEEASAPSTKRRVHASVKVTLGDDVRVETYGLKAHLGGEVLVTSDPGEEPRGEGAIRVLEGEYKAFGVYVKITKGVLSYHDAPLALPTLDLVAEREIKDEDVKVAVNVRGRIDKPFVTVSSQPAMPSNEALSYLLTGRSINTLQSNEAVSVNKAAESLAVSGGGLLLGGLGSRLGLDEVSVEGTRDKDTQVVLGKFLSPKLFVSYGVSIAEAINTIKLRYTMNPRWALKAEAGLAQSADVEFKIER